MREPTGQDAEHVGGGEGRVEEEADAHGGLEATREAGGHEHQLVALDPNHLVLLVSTRSRRHSRVHLLDRLRDGVVHDRIVVEVFVHQRAVREHVIHGEADPHTPPTHSHVHAVVQHGPQHLLAEPVVVTLQHLLVDEHGEAVQLTQRLLHLPALRHRHVDAQRDAAHVPRLTRGEKRGGAQLIECGVVGLPRDAGEQTQLIELRLPLAVFTSRQVDGEELRDEQQRLLAVLVRRVVARALVVTTRERKHVLRVQSAV